MHAGEEDHARPGWTTSKRGQDSPWKSQSERQRTEINVGSIRPWHVEPSDRGRLKNRTEQASPYAVHVAVKAQCKVKVKYVVPL